MRLPSGCGNEPGKVVLLNRSLRGLKQAGRAGSTLFGKTLKERGFERRVGDLCISRLMRDRERDDDFAGAGGRHARRRYE